jgi:two-component system NtrC family sensor kinase
VTQVTGMDLYERVGSIAPELVGRFIFITGGAHTERAEAFFEQAGILRLDKPFLVEELRSVVRANLVRLAGAGDHRIDVVENDR